MHEPEEDEAPVKKFRVAPDQIKLTNVIKLFDKPLRPIKPQKLIETSELSERLRQRHKPAGS
jgi:hypothetical protein